MNSYLIESIDSLSLEEKIRNIIDNTGFSHANINSYDLEEVDISNALEDLDTYNFLTPKKVVIIRNIEILKYDCFVINYCVSAISCSNMI